jgi:phospholipid-binding lipoprotein MlaA
MFSPLFRSLAVLSIVVLSACAAPQTDSAFNDPFEPTNRQVHKLNRELDRLILQPTSTAYGVVVPDPVKVTVSNFASNAGLPGDVVNNVLQADVGGAATNTLRFILNTTIGIGGLFDPAGAIGLTAQESDFGETLYVWGVSEGPLVELPVIGPNTSRHAAGKLVDFVLDPVGNLLDRPDIYYTTGAQVASGLGTRYRFAETIESVLYESADSYAQSRLIYLQNRRFSLGSDAEEDYFDPYDDPYEALE